MTGTDMLALLPLLITAYGGVALMVVGAFWRSHTGMVTLALVGFAAGLGSVFLALPYAPRPVTPLIQMDSYSLYFAGLLLAAALLITLLSGDYLPQHETRNEAFYALLMLAVLGMVGLAASAHFVAFFLALETLSVSLYGLIGYTRGFRQSVEGAVKYLVLAAASSAFLLLGIAFVYADLGTMDFRRLAPLIAASGMPQLTLMGMGLILVGFGFKLALVPFHMWSPDVYQGAPAPVTALIATGSKGAILALLLRLASLSGFGSNHTAFLLLAVLSITTMLGGNLLALLQTNVKRMLAYSSVAHMGYLILPVLAGKPLGPPSIAFYLVSYFATTIAAFGVIAVLSSTRPLGDLEELEDYRGLSRRHPVLAAIFALSLLSLTGIPLTAGFIAKFLIFAAAIHSGLWVLVLVGVVSSGISAFYYLRVLIALYTHPETEPAPLPTARSASAAALAFSTLVMVFFGIYPAPLIQLATLAVRQLAL